MKRIELEHLWRPEGWLSPALVSIDERGNVAEVCAPRPGDMPDERVRGYALPGMPNLHSHAFQRAMAGIAEHRTRADESFWTWRTAMYELAAKIGPDDLEAVATELYVEMLQAGYTAVVEFQYLHRASDGSPYAEPAELSLRIARAAERAGIRLTLLPVLYQRGGFGRAPSPEQLRFVLETDELLSVAARIATLFPEVRVGVAPHSLRAVAPDALASLVAGLSDRSAPIHIHVAEQVREVEECIAALGARPVEWLADHVELGERWCLVHATHATELELELVGRSGAVVGLCPTTEANLGDGVFPLPAWLAHGGRFGIGSDSNVSVSLVEELRWLEYSQRLALRRRGVTAGADALFGAALDGGARASGRPLAGIAPGAPADLIVLDPEHPALAERPLERVLDAFVFASSSPAVRDVMVAGRWRVRDGRHAEADEARAAFRAALRRLA
jgi:formimidoylglutamate deiminase